MDNTGYSVAAGQWVAGKAGYCVSEEIAHRAFDDDDEEREARAISSLARHHCERRESARLLCVCCSSMFLSVVRSRFACKLRATGRKEGGHRIAAGRAEFCVAEDEGA